MRSFVASGGVLTCEDCETITHQSIFYPGGEGVRHEKIAGCVLSSLLGGDRLPGCTSTEGGLLRVADPGSIELPVTSEAITYTTNSHPLQCETDAVDQHGLTYTFNVGTMANGCCLCAPSTLPSSHIKAGKRRPAQRQNKQGDWVCHI